MKKISTLIASILIGFTAPLIGQTNISVLTGLHLGQTSNSVVSADFLDLKSVSNWNVGIMLDRSLDQNLMFSTGLMYKKKGFEISETTSVNVLGIQVPLGISVINSINYLEVPLLIKYQKQGEGIQPYFSAGPIAAYALSASVSTRATAIIDFSINESELSLKSDDFNRLDLLLNANTGVTIPYGQGSFIAEVGYSHGLNNFTSNSFIIDTGLKNRGWNFNVGYGLYF